VDRLLVPLPFSLVQLAPTWHQVFHRLEKTLAMFQFQFARIQETRLVFQVLAVPVVQRPAELQGLYLFEPVNFA
jgi:hypothetical protein